MKLAGVFRGVECHEIVEWRPLVVEVDPRHTRASLHDAPPPVAD